MEWLDTFSLSIRHECHQYNDIFRFCAKVGAHLSVKISRFSYFERCAPIGTFVRFSEAALISTPSRNVVPNEMITSVAINCRQSPLPGYNQASDVTGCHITGHSRGHRPPPPAAPGRRDWAATDAGCLWMWEGGGEAAGASASGSCPRPADVVITAPR